jgi:hypothetical protein
MSIYNRIYHILIEGQTDWSQEEEGDDFQSTSKKKFKPKIKHTTNRHQLKRKQTQYQKDLQRKWPEGRSRTQKPT